MKYRNWIGYLFVSFITLLSCNTNKNLINTENYADTPTISKINKSCDFELLMCMSALTTRAHKIVEKNGITNIKLINMGFVDTKDKAIVDEEKLTKVIEDLFPDKTQKYIGMFDWEGKALESLINLPQESKEYQRVYQEHIKAYKIAKKLRPKIKFGFYGMPTCDYWVRDDKWRKKNMKLIPLLKEFDILFPCIYDYYKDSNPNAGKERDHLYVKENVEISIEIGKQLKKPIYPVIWHRWLNKDECDECLIPLEEFIPHIQAALAASYKGGKIDGLVWWGEDKYYYTQKSNALTREVSKKINFETYEFEIIESYTRAIYKAFDNECAKTNTN